MSLFSRICQSKLKHLTNQRRYPQISYASLLSSSNPKQYVTENPFRVIRRRPTDFGNNVRGFAAPVQVKPKKEEKDTGGPRLNDQIKAEFVRLVSDEGHSILSRREALELARKLNHDLVEVQRTANPPVCKIMDFHREKYKQQIKGKDRAKSKSEVTLRKGDHKEVRFSGKTEEKDLKMKADMVKRLMDRGYRVKCAARGTEGQDLGGLLSRLSALIEDVSVIESGPRVEKGQAYIIVRHVKFGPSKKGGGKNPKVVENIEPKILNATTGTQPEEEEMDPAEFSLETEYDDEVDNLNDKKTAWSVADATNDFDEVFDFGDNSNGNASKPTSKQMNGAVDGSASSMNSDDDISNPTRPRPLVFPSQPQSSIRAENRYKKSEPISRFQTTNGINNKGQGFRDSPRPEPRRQPAANANFSPLNREIEQVETDTSGFRNIKLPPKYMAKQEPSRPSAPNTPRPGFGVFRASEKHGATVARIDRGSSDSSRNPSTEEASAKSEGNPIKSEQTGWGIFSRESVNGTPNRMSKPN